MRNILSTFQLCTAAGMNSRYEAKITQILFLLQEVEYLGHKISANGLQPTTEKVQAIVPIVQAPQPTNVTQLKSFLGMINYYGKFLPNLSTCLAPLYKLLQKQFCWRWG